jgi:hypothetical protein
MRLLVLVLALLGFIVTITHADVGVPFLRPVINAIQTVAPFAVQQQGLDAEYCRDFCISNSAYTMIFYHNFPALSATFSHPSTVGRRKMEQRIRLAYQLIHMYTDYVSWVYHLNTSGCVTVDSAKCFISETIDESFTPNNCYRSGILGT